MEVVGEQSKAVTFANMTYERQQSKIFRIEVKTLNLSNCSRQLLVISDVTHILKAEKKKIQLNFQQQLTASLSHEQLTPLNSILYGSDLLQSNILVDLVNKTFGDPLYLKKGSSKSHENEVISKLLTEFYNKQKETYDFARIIWSSAQIMSYMLMSQMSHTKLSTKMLVC